MTRFARLLLALMTLGAACICLPSQAAGSMRCNGRIIDDSALEAEVLGNCGEPAYRDSWSTRTRNNAYVVDSEDWYYNFGSSQLLMVLRMRNGRVANIGSDGYGYDNPPQPPCNPLDIAPGMSKFRLVLACGQPATKNAKNVLAPLEPTPDNPYPGTQVVPIYREEWVYNFGTSYLLRIVTLENGRVSDVQNGNRGF